MKFLRSKHEVEHVCGLHCTDVCGIIDQNIQCGDDNVDILFHEIFVDIITTVFHSVLTY